MHKEGHKGEMYLNVSYLGPDVLASEKQYINLFLLLCASFQQ